MQKELFDATFLNYKWAITEIQNDASQRRQYRQLVAKTLVLDAYRYQIAIFVAQLALDFGNNVATEFCELVEAAEIAIREQRKKDIGDPGFPEWANKQNSP
jgi:hypothetical protein